MLANSCHVSRGMAVRNVTGPWPAYQLGGSWSRHRRRWERDIGVERGGEWERGSPSRLRGLRSVESSPSGVRADKNERTNDRMCPIEWHYYGWPLVTLKVSLAVWNLYVHSPRWFASRCTGGVIRGVVNNNGDSRRWVITVSVQLISTILFLWKSVDDTHGIACLLCDSCAKCNDACTKQCR